MTAKEIANKWNSMTDDQQIELVWKCVWTKINQGRTVAPSDTLDDVFQSTFEGVLTRLENLDKLEAYGKRRESQGKAPDTLAGVVFRSANAVLARSAYNGKKNGKATRWTITSQDGDEIDVLDTVAAAAGTERAATIRATLKEFFAGLDSKNKIIFGGMVQGRTERELAPTVEISNIAVHKRMVKIRAALAEII